MPENEVESDTLAGRNDRKYYEVGGLMLSVRMVLVILLNAMLSFIVVQILPYFYTVLYSTNIYKLLHRLAKDPKLTILAIHILNLPVINISLILAVSLRIFASRKQCICRVKQAIAPAELLIFLQLIFVIIVACRYGVRYCQYIPISLVQFVCVHLSFATLHCPCRYCQGKPVMYFTYMDKTIDFKNFDFCMTKTFIRRLEIPPGPFLLYNTYRNEYFTSENLMELLFPIYTNTRKRYTVKPLAEFHPEEADQLGDYIKRVCFFIKNPELEMLILANHPSIRHYIEA